MTNQTSPAANDQAFNPHVYCGFSFEAMEPAFAAVQDKSDWRNPIDARVSGEQVHVTCVAIAFYTATEPVVEYDREIGDFRVTSEGYRMGPAGP